MKNFILLLTVIILLVFGCATTKHINNIESDYWQLVWQEEFNGTRIDTTIWSKISRGGSDWEKHMSSHESLYDVKNGCVILRATKNSVDANDASKYITGGIYTKGKQSFGYGKIEIRAKYTSAKGYWPALWLMPDKDIQWPYGGEIDIMEHINFDNMVYQTVHTPFTRNTEYKQPISNSHKTTIDPNEFNIYGLERYRDSIVFFVNRERVMSYPKIDSLSHREQFPFNKSKFYILMDSQLGGAWVGDINPSHLPAELLIDWVRYYEPKTRDK